MRLHIFIVSISKYISLLINANAFTLTYDANTEIKNNKHVMSRLQNDLILYVGRMGMLYLAFKHSLIASVQRAFQLQ